VAVASADLVAFTDDDCLLPPDHLRALVDCFADLDVGWLAGRILDGGGPGDDDIGGPGDDPQARVALLEDDTFRYFTARRPLRVGAVQGANLAARREAVMAVGGFDERMGAGTPFRCEDADFCARLLARGYPGARHPRLVVFHAHGRDAGGARALEAANDRARGAFTAERLLAGDGDRLAYLGAWAGDAIDRWGWRPVNARRAAAVTGRELWGGARWALGRHAGPRRPPQYVAGSPGAGRS
jgi:hypothetical protein